MTAKKTRATKPQPKPLDPLEEMVREEILRVDNSKVDRLCDDLLATRDDRVTKIAGALHAMIDGVELPPLFRSPGRSPGGGFRRGTGGKVVFHVG